MSAEEDQQLLVLESTQVISDDLTMECLTVNDDNSASNSFTFSKDVSKNIPSSECDDAKEEEDEEHKSSPEKKKKLVSALKGSREKEGNWVKGKELSRRVTWAPEVYDPLPSASQTSIKIKKLRPKKKKNLEDYKKNGKYKQKGKVDKGGSSSKSKSKSMPPIQRQGGDDGRMWWQEEQLDEIYDEQTDMSHD